MNRFPLKTWLVVFGATLGWILYDAQQPKQEGTVVAEIVQVSGRITGRRSGSFDWIPLKNADKLYNFDSIASKQGSSARLKLQDGSSLVLPEDTQLRIQKNTLDTSWNLFLSKGSLAIARAPSSAGKAVPNMKITSDKHQIDISQLKGSLSMDDKGTIATKNLEQVRLETQHGAVSLAKLASDSKSGKNAENFPGVFPFVMLAPLQLKQLADELDLGKILKNKALSPDVFKESESIHLQAEVVKSAPASIPEQPKAIAGEDNAPRLAAQKLRPANPPEPTPKTLASELPSPSPTPPTPPTSTPTPEPLKVEDNNPVPPDFPEWQQTKLSLWRFGSVSNSSKNFVNLTFDRTKFDSKSWQLILRVSSKGTKKYMDLPIAVDARQLQLAVTELPEWEARQGKMRLEYNLSFVFKSLLQKEAKEHLGPSLQLSLVLPPTDRPLLITLDGWASHSETVDWIEEKPVTQASLKLYVRSLADVEKLIPYIIGANGFEIRSGLSKPENGFQLLKGNDFIAVIQHSDETIRNAIPEALGIDLMYSGSADDLMGMSGNLDWARALREEKDIFYLYKGKWIQLDKSLATTTESTLELVKRLSPYVFRRPVPISFSRK